MYKYKELQGEIVACQEIQNGQVIKSFSKYCLDYEDLDWKETEKEIVAINGKLIFSEGELYKVETNLTEINSQLSQLKTELATYDYIGVKIAMGVATKEEYAEQIAYTQTLRKRINELQEQL